MHASRQPNFALLLGLAWLLVVFQLLAQNWAETAQTLLDTDDAMRLAQLRDWLAGRGWYDLTQPRVQPPLGYELHWSRLIDAGLAGTLWIFGLVLRSRARRAADAHRLADALAAADHGGHRRDCLAHRRTRGRADRAVAGAGRAAGVPPIPAGPHRPSQCADRALGARRSPRPCGPTACAGRPTRRAR